MYFPHYHNDAPEFLTFEEISGITNQNVMDEPHPRNALSKITISPYPFHDHGISSTR